MNKLQKQPWLDVFKSGLVKLAKFSPVYEFPILARSDHRADRAVQFDKALALDRAKKHERWIHFYIHDYRFERLWYNPKQYLDLFKRFEGAIGPDFSIYRELPLAMQVWNTYRNRALAYWLQQNGVPVIPNVRWGDERTYGFAFEGLPIGGTFAVSTNGCIRDKLDRHYFKKGLARMVDALHPDTIVNYSYTPDDIFKEYKDQGIAVIQIPNDSYAARRKRVR